MSKLIATVGGIILFVYMSFFVIGITYGYMEQQSFVNVRDEILQRVVEADPADLSAGVGRPVNVKDMHTVGVAGRYSPLATTSTDPGVVKIIKNMGEQFDKAYVTVYFNIIKDEPDEQGKLGTVSLGDELQVLVAARGSGSFGFVKRKETVQGESLDEFKSGKPYYVSVRNVTITNRSAKRI